MRTIKYLLKGVEEVVNRHDPVGLISGGAPSDEYANEVIKIVKLLPCDKQKLAEEIYKVFVCSFDERTAGDKDAYEMIAEEVFDKSHLFFEDISKK